MPDQLADEDYQDGETARQDNELFGGVKEVVHDLPLSNN
jgi:hypothetical protein